MDRGDVARAGLVAAPLCGIVTTILMLVVVPLAAGATVFGGSGAGDVVAGLGFVGAIAVLIGAPAGLVLSALPILVAVVSWMPLSQRWGTRRAIVATSVLVGVVVVVQLVVAGALLEPATMLGAFCTVAIWSAVPAVPITMATLVAFARDRSPRPSSY